MSCPLLANLSDTFKTNLIAWLGDAQNGIDKILAYEIVATNGTFSSVLPTGFAHAAKHSGGLLTK